MAEIAFPLSLGVLLLWSWPPARLVLPMLPFLIIYLITGLRAVFRLQDKYLLAGSVPNPWKPAAFVAGCLLTINLYGNFDYIAHKYSKDRQDWIINFEEHKAMLDWMRDHISKENAVATYNAPLIFLYTGLKSVTIANPEENWERWKRLGVRYLARTPLKGTPIPPPDLNEGRFNIVYRSKGKLNLRVSDFGPASTRIPWNSSIPVNQRKIETFN